MGGGSIMANVLATRVVDSSLYTYMTCMGYYEIKPPMYEDSMEKQMNAY